MITVYTCTAQNNQLTLIIPVS